MDAPAEDPRSIRRLEDPRFLRGDARYIEDMPAAGQLHGVFVRSPHAHAAILHIDAAAAAAMPGVRGVFTSADLVADGVAPVPCTMALASMEPLIVPPRHALADGHARFVGEPVLLVVADSVVAARDAAEAVVVDYDILPSVTRLVDVAGGELGGPLVWAQAPGNIAYRFQRGDEAAVAAAFGGAAHVAAIELENNRVVPASLETRGAIASHDPGTGRLRLELSGQDVHGLRRDLALSFGVAADMIQVTCPDVGGGFGMKNVVHPEYVALLWAARRLGRQVRWIADRTEDFLSAAHGRDNLTTARLALDGKGRFLALHVSSLCNLGAYVSALGPGAHTNSPASAMGGVYDVPAVFMDVRGAFTHTVPIDAYRGAGKPEANYLIERLVDIAARQMGIDRVELRRRNVIRAFPHVSALGIPMDSGRFAATIEAAALHAAGFEGRRAEAARRGVLLGQGVACFLETSRGAPTEWAKVRFQPGGIIDLLTGTQNNGQGLETAFPQLAAAEFGLPIGIFRLVQADSDVILRGSGHGGARSLVMAGTALRMAIDAALGIARTEAARLLQAAPLDVHYAEGRFTTRDGAEVTLATLAETLAPGTLDAEAVNPNDQFVFPAGCHVAEVEVDPETGAHRLTRYVASDDYGVLLNPLLASGQVQGGLAQGIGQALHERVHYDAESGQLLTATFADYAIPRASDLPELDIHFAETPTERNPLGAKGSGQAGAIAAPQVVMNALADALDVDHIDMPATPERVWRALR